LFIPVKQIIYRERESQRSFSALSSDPLFARGFTRAQGWNCFKLRWYDSKKSFVGELTVRVIRLTATGSSRGKMKTVTVRLKL